MAMIMAEVIVSRCSHSSLPFILHCRPPLSRPHASHIPMMACLGSAMTRLVRSICQVCLRVVISISQGSIYEFTLTIIYAAAHTPHPLCASANAIQTPKDCQRGTRWVLNRGCGTIEQLFASGQAKIFRLIFEALTLLIKRLKLCEQGP